MKYYLFFWLFCSIGAEISALVRELFSGASVKIEWEVERYGNPYWKTKYKIVVSKKLIALTLLAV